jgi:hypothetical protein
VSDGRHFRADVTPGEWARAKNRKKKDPDTETSRRFQTSRREEKDRMRRYAPVRSLNEGRSDSSLLSDFHFSQLVPSAGVRDWVVAAKI